MTTTTHGGTRPGAGRPPLEGGSVTVCLVLRQAQADWLEVQAAASAESKSEVVRRLVDRAMKARRR